MAEATRIDAAIAHIREVDPLLPVTERELQEALEDADQLMGELTSAIIEIRDYQSRL